MSSPAAVDLLLALLEPGDAWDVSGNEVIGRLQDAGLAASPARVMARLLRLETQGLVRVERQPEHRFRLTPAGEEAAYAHGPGSPIDVTLVMADLVGFVAYTTRRGDKAAHRAAWSFQRCAEQSLQAGGGDAVKGLGDGVLGTAPSAKAALTAVRELAHHCRDLDGEPWQLRAAVHRGRPVAHRGDLFGADVNLVARMCDVANPGEALLTGGGTEHLDLRGLDHPVTVERVLL
ncbi:MAG: hypothetical protein WKF43_07755 [Acidimicrobiales bacterium]